MWRIARRGWARPRAPPPRPPDPVPSTRQQERPAGRLRGRAVAEAVLARPRTLKPVTDTTEPTVEFSAGRAQMPGSYGLKGPKEGRGLLPWSQVQASLQSARNYWVVTSSAEGIPHAAPG